MDVARTWATGPFPTTRTRMPSTISAYPDIVSGSSAQHDDPQRGRAEDVGFAEAFLHPFTPAVELRLVAEVRRVRVRRLRIRQHRRGVRTRAPAEADHLDVAGPVLDLDVASRRVPHRRDHVEHAQEARPAVDGDAVAVAGDRLAVPQLRVRGQ